MLSASHNSKKINPNRGRRGSHTSVSNLWHLGPQGRNCAGACRARGRAAWAGTAPSGYRTSPCRSGWGFWESELQLTWSKCDQEGPAGCEGAKGGGWRGCQRENNGHSSPWHVKTSSNDRCPPAVLSLRCRQASFGRWQDKGPRLDFFSLNDKGTTPTAAPPLSCRLLSSAHHPDTPAEPSLGG